MTQKICPRCKILKELTDFHKCVKYKDGKQVYCIECRRTIIREYKRKKYHEDSEHREYLRKYNKKKRSTQRYKDYMNKYFKDRKRENIQYKISCNLRIRMWQVLNGINKSKNTLKLLGCSLEELKNHLESQFKSGMTWQNYGRNGWHIDHIIPCDSFNLKIKSEQEKCFNYKNLQPLWAHDNLSKSNKLL